MKAVGCLTRGKILSPTAKPGRGQEKRMMKVLEMKADALDAH
jgi:hypothetical protein